MILVDSSVWVDHLRAGDPTLAGLLNRSEVLTHPFVVGELALGRIGQRTLVLSALQNLPQAAIASDPEVLNFIDSNGLQGRGIGYVDAHLLASLRLSPGARLWTRDRRLREVAASLSLAASQI